MEPGGSFVVSLALALWWLYKGCRAFVVWFDRHTSDNPQENIRMNANLSRPRPLRTIGSIVGGLTALVAGLVGAGLLSPGTGTAIEGVINAVVVLLGTLGIVVTAERKVTPLSDPRDNDGTALVPAQREDDLW
ncbi:hypothetical protein AB0A74_06920 [Saccharothrix sp. NPDC042600]|uniref:hypothetical protein n=1 Tax=Saccharothrix TaxID=2071 RepID=UPI0033C0789A|nr:hypothetical protein GCM10017745_30950 [Saccharothrix mutabilis subsp. capreolus]